MKTITHETSGCLIITENSTFHCIDLKSVLVEEDIVARLYGLVEDLIHIKRGALLYLHGKLNGKIINEGGTIYIFGPEGEVHSYGPDISVASDSQESPKAPS